MCICKNYAEFAIHLPNVTVKDNKAVYVVHVMFQCNMRTCIVPNYKNLTDSFISFVNIY